MGVFHEWSQNTAIEQALKDASEGLRLAQELSGRVMALEDQVTSLSLLAGGLRKMLVEKTGMTEEELQAQIAALGSGEAAAGLPASPDCCANCKRRINRNFRNCIYCGHPTSVGE